MYIYVNVYVFPLFIAFDMIIFIFCIGFVGFDHLIYQGKGTQQYIIESVSALLFFYLLFDQNIFTRDISPVKGWFARDLATYKNYSILKQK